MFNTLTVLTAIHVIAATLWIGAGFALNVMLSRSFASGSSGEQGFALKTAGFIGPKLLTPLSLVVFASGVWLTAKYYSWDLLWINYGMVGVVITFLVGAFYLGPRSGRIAGAIAGGAGQDEVRAMWRPVTLVSRLDMLLLISIVAIMVFKPE